MLGFALVHEGNVYYFNNDPHSKNHIIIPELSPEPFGLSDALSLTDLFRESEMFCHGTISTDRIGVLEGTVESEFVDIGPHGYNISNIIAFLYEELFPFLCGKDADRQFTEKASLANIIAERKDVFRQSLDLYLNRFKQNSLEQKPFVKQVTASLKSLTAKFKTECPIKDISLTSLPHLLSSTVQGSYLMWGNFLYMHPVMPGEGTSCLVLGSGESSSNPSIHVPISIDWNLRKSCDIKDELDSALKAAYAAYLASTIPEELIAQFYSRTKYTSVMVQGRVDHDIFGFEVIKSGSQNVPGVFVYMKIPPIFVQDPRVWLDAYYPYPAKDLGLEMTYHKGHIKILGNQVRGPTKHYAIAAGEHRFGSMCNFQSRDRKMFESDVAWIASNLMVVVEMFTNGLTVENLIGHNAALLTADFNGYNKMPTPVTYQEVLKQGGLIVNKHEWPAEKWPSGIDRTKYLDRF